MPPSSGVLSADFGSGNGIEIRPAAPGTTGQPASASSQTITAAKPAAGSAGVSERLRELHESLTFRCPPANPIPRIREFRRASRASSPVGSTAKPTAFNAAIVRGLKALGVVPALKKRTSGMPWYDAAALPIIAPSMLRREFPVHTTTTGNGSPGR